MASTTSRKDTLDETTAIMNCQECCKSQALYQCPRCDWRTCSLDCCTSHKRRLNCNGKRNVTKFLSLSRMDDATLRSDYHFLENILSTVDGGKRLLTQVGGISSGQMDRKSQRRVAVESDKTNGNDDDADTADADVSGPLHDLIRLQVNDDDSNNDEPRQSKRPRTTTTTTTMTTAPKWIRLIREAQTRSTTLLLMPSGMQRHQSNTSYYQIKTDTIYWKVDFLCHSSKRVMIYSISQLSEHAVVYEELIKLLPECSTKEFHLLVKKLPCPSNAPRYVELVDPQTTLQTLLQNLTIIEHPVIDVVSSQDLHKFPRAIQQV